MGVYRHTGSDRATFSGGDISSGTEYATTKAKRLLTANHVNLLSFRRLR